MFCFSREMERLQTLLYDTSCSTRLLYYHAYSCGDAHVQPCPRMLQYREARRMYDEVVAMIEVQRTLDEREEAVEEEERPDEEGRVAAETEAVGSGPDEGRVASEAEDRIRRQIAEAQSFISDIELPTLIIGAYLGAESGEP